MKIPRGSVVLIELDPALGHEQRGFRPCIVVSDSEVTVDQRFPMVCIVPVTGTEGKGLLYPPLAPGASGLAKQSFALIDQIRSVDKRRIRRLYGQISNRELTSVDEGIAAYLGMKRNERGLENPSVH